MVLTQKDSILRADILTSIVITWQSDLNPKYKQLTEKEIKERYDKQNQLYQFLRTRLQKDTLYFVNNYQRP
jgi:hypothetical protein